MRGRPAWRGKRIVTREDEDGRMGRIGGLAAAGAAYDTCTAASFNAARGGITSGIIGSRAERWPGPPVAGGQDQRRGTVIADRQNCSEGAARRQRRRRMRRIGTRKVYSGECGGEVDRRRAGRRHLRLPGTAIHGLRLSAEATTKVSPVCADGPVTPSLIVKRSFQTIECSATLSGVNTIWKTPPPKSL